MELKHENVLFMYIVACNKYESVNLDKQYNPKSALNMQYTDS